MKHFLDMLRLWTLLLAAGLMVACGGDGGAGDDPDGPTTPTTLAASPSSLSFEGAGGTQQLTIASPTGWSLSSSASWCYAKQTAGLKGTTTVEVVAAANEGKERTAKLTLSASGCNPVEIAVAQAAPPVDPTLVVAEPDSWDGVRRSDMIYQLLVYAFADSNGDNIGDFNGITAKMDYIASLGAGAIWLSPIHPADSYHGYDVTDYTAVNPDYGTMTDFENMVKAAHDRGIKIYLDYVVNHTGKGHPWYTDTLEKGEQSPYWRYYNLSYNPASEVAAGKFPMVSTYNGDDWKTPYGMSEPEAATHRYKFVVSTSNGKPTSVVVSETSEAAQSQNTDSSVNIFLFYGKEGVAYRMYDKGNGVYELICDFNSPWGFLVRTSNSDSWPSGTKYGGNGSYIELGKAYALNNTTASDIQFDYMRSLKIFAPIFGVWMPEINYGVIGDLKNNASYQHIIASAKGWLDKGVDGFRLDAAKHVYGIWSIDSRDYTFWSSFHSDLNAYYKTKPQYEGKDLYLVAEIFDSTGVVKGFAQHTPLSAFNFDYWWNVLPSALNSGNGRSIASGLKGLQDQLKSVNANYVDAVKMTNHDEDRAGSGLEGNINRMRTAGMILQTVSGRPVVYYGEELAYTGTKSSSDIYVRQPMRWSATEYPKFTGALADNFSSFKSVAGLENDSESILNAYRQFGQLRNIYPAMTNAGTMTPCYNSSSYPGALSAYYREASGVKLLVLHNVAGQTINFTINDTVDKAVALIGQVKRDGKKITMTGHSSVVFKLK
ncbi:MAG: alpha-amylase [Alistipes sp.]|nr:alpha-amylase [Alistipes sp.]